MNVGKAMVLPIAVFVVFAILTKGALCQFSHVVDYVRQSVVPALICYGIVLNMSVGTGEFLRWFRLMLVAGIIGGNLALLTGTGIPGMIFLLCTYRFTHWCVNRCFVCQNATTSVPGIDHRHDDGI